MGPRGDAEREFHERLVELYRAAGKPTYLALARRTKVPASTLNEWLTGGTVPSDGAKLAVVVGVLKSMAGGGCPPDPVGGWERLRIAARHGRHSGRSGGRAVVRRMLGPVPQVVDYFQERPEIAQLEAAAGGTAVLGQLVVGMGGVGKTQLAARYARAAFEAARVDILLWVTAASLEAVADAYAHAAGQILGADVTDPQAAWLFRNWLALPPGEREGGPVPGARWVIVLDDVPDTSAVGGLWPPDVPHGRTVVTTRNQDAALLAGRARVNVGLFTSQQAIAYLTQKLAAYGRVDDAEQIAGLAEDLGRLPLALAQAVPFMINRNLDCAAYRQRLADRANTLADVLPPQGGLPDQQNRTVAAAWDLSIDLADQQPPCGLARPLLHLLSLLDPNGIPTPILTTEPVQTHLTAQRPTRTNTPTGHTAAVDQDDINDALTNLRQFSLLTLIPDSPHHTVRIHQLLQRAVYERFTPDYAHTCARTAADALVDAWPGIERDTALATALRANTAVLTHTAGNALYQRRVHPVLFRYGQSLGEAGQVRAAIIHFTRLAAEAHHHLGPDDPDTLITRHNLARWRGEAGDPAGAATAYEELLADMVRVLGPDHPHTLTTRNNLAAWRDDAEPS